MKLISTLSCIALLFSPALSDAATPVTHTSAGLYHSAFVKSDGSLWTMGYNDMGQVGNGTTNRNIFVPEEIVAGDVTAIDAGEWHTAFLKSDASLWTMGWNDWGELGDGTFSNRYAPTLILPGTVRKIGAGGFTTLILRSDSPLEGASLWATGRNSFGELGNGTDTDTNTPVLIVPATPETSVIEVSGGNSHSLFLKSDGSLWGMGYNFDGELGDGSSTDRLLPVQIVSSNVTAIAAGGFHSLFLKDDGSLWAMGQNRLGQLGDGTTNNRYLPVQIVASNVTEIAGGYRFSLFLKSDGSLWGMGDNYSSQLGNGLIGESHVPEKIVSSNVVAIASGGFHSLYTKSDGSLWGMGQNYNGQLGIGLPSLTVMPLPTRIVPLATVNGSFETADLLGWTTNDAFSSLENRVTTKAAYVRSGRYGLQLGQVGSPAYLTQQRPTTPGTQYLVSFWLNNLDGAAPNEFSLSWNGAPLWSGTNLTSTGWTHHQFLIMATGTTAALQFAFRNDLGYFGLDDITIAPVEQPTITSVSAAQTNLILGGAGGIAGGSYVTLASTNVATSLNQWTSIATNVLSDDGNFTLTATNAVAPNLSQQFYILQLR